MNTRSALVLASVLVAVGCGGTNPDDSSGSSDVVPCVGDACWDCKPIQIKSGVQVVCENDAQTNDGVPRSWECPSAGHLCPPIDVITTTVATSDGVLGDSESGGHDDEQNPGSNDGVSTADAGAGGTHDAGATLEAGSVVGKDAGGAAQDAASCADSGAGGSAGDAGASGDAGGGGFHCSSDGTKTVCEGTPTCAPGTHLTSCGQCVSDSCTSCSCGGGSDGGAVDAGSLGCTLTQGYWKTHAKAWPVQSLVLGGKSYTHAELLAILNTPANGDASIILAYQLIAAKLNVLSGSSSSPVGSVIAQADAWLAAHADADGRLPYGVASSSAAGQVAVTLGAELDAYNNGLSGVPHCK